MCTISGPDGAGKTTLCESLQRQLELRGIHTVYAWTRWSGDFSRPLFRIFGWQPTRWSDRPRISHLEQLAREWIEVPEYTLLTLIRLSRAIRQQPEVLIVDRYVMDATIDLAIHTRKERLELDKFSQYLVDRLPKPKLSVVLIPNDATLRARRPDAEGRELLARVSLYERAARAPGYIVLNAEIRPGTLAEQLVELMATSLVAT